MTGAPAPPPVAEDTIVRFPRGIRLHHDRVRDQWVIQAPERAFIADPIAAEILQLVDGTRPLAAIIDLLAERFAAPRPVIARDVLDMVAGLAQRQVLAT
ncbi:pyrroloquinoline quinone biosynthesis peptide chaperone PqqD [Gluconacetobacter sacchari]|uniref:pyrroloquinoline quinone biosynthesis peptide chaperone PqqD n=1 Tax=Gluconacetobacter sacchari TaxID=92759 RepID=UPI0039B6A9A7